MSSIQSKDGDGPTGAVVIVKERRDWFEDVLRRN